MSLSPSTTSPFSSTATTRSASPSRAMPRRARFATTARHSASGAVEPQLSLMLTPSGWSLIITMGMARRFARRPTVVDAAPLAASTTTLKSGKYPCATPARCSTYSCAAVER